MDSPSFIFNELEKKEKEGKKSVIQIGIKHNLQNLPVLYWKRVLYNHRSIKPATGQNQSHDSH